MYLSVFSEVTVPRSPLETPHILEFGTFLRTSSICEQRILPRIQQAAITNRIAAKLELS